MNRRKAPRFDLTLFTNLGGVLTKKLYREHSKIRSIPPKMFSGIASRHSLTLSDLPDFLSGLRTDQCFATGVVGGDVPQAEILTVPEFESRGFSYPSHKDETGVYATRSSKSMEQAGPSLIMFDHDHDPSSTEKIDSPEVFLSLLARAAPELMLEDVCYVRTYSTSTSLYHKETKECLVPANGFHLYMVVKDGTDVKRFADVLNKRCWLAGLGHIKISSNGSRLPRTVFDTAVFQPERLCFEAGAFIDDSQDFYQDLPDPEYVLKNQPYLDTKKLKTLAPETENAYRVKLEAAKNSEKVIERVEALRETNVQRLVNSTHYTNKPLTRKEAQAIVHAKERLILHPRDILEFEDGRTITVLDAYLRADEFDNCGLKDPLRPDKGFSRAMFYANRGDISNDCNPVINSFLEGGRIFTLRQSLHEFMSQGVESECGLTDLDPRAKVFEERYFPEVELNKGLNLIKGEPGTGKTEAISNAARRYEGRVLAISHRIGLDSALCSRFDLISYNDLDKESSYLLRVQKRLGICYNSLYKLEGQSYGMVILDEVTQVLRHMKSGTIDHPVACLRTLRSILANAEYVVAMDADLTKTMVEKMLDAEYGVVKPDIDVTCVINLYKPALQQERKLTLYQDDEGKACHAPHIEKMMEAVETGGLFYASNSKADVLAKAALIIDRLGGDSHIAQEHFITEVDGRRVITITSGNSQTPDVKAFTEDITASLRPGDILLGSPSIGTGLSINATDGVPLFPVTFGFFTKMARNLPSDCLQHLARVRGCQEFHVVYADNKRHDDESVPAIIEREILGKPRMLDKRLRVRWQAEYDYATGNIRPTDHGWSQWYGELTAMENAQRNQFGSLLEQQLKESGYEVSTLFTGTEVGFRLKSRKDDIDAELRAIERETLAETPLITDLEYEKLSKQTLVNSDERRQIFKKRIADLFGFNENGDDLNQVVTASQGEITARRKALILGACPEQLFLLDICHRVDTTKFDKDKTAYYDHQILLTGFLGEFGVAFPNQLPSYDGRQIGDMEKHFAFEYLLENAQGFDYLHGIRIKEVKNDKGKQALVGRVLQSVGLKYRYRQTGRRGAQTRIYHLDEARIERMKTDILRARERSTWTIYSESHEVPDILKNYWFQYLAGSPQNSTFWPYLSRLAPEDLARLHRALERCYYLTKGAA